MTIFSTPVRKRVLDREQAGNRDCVVCAFRERPSDDDLIACVTINLAAGVEHRLGHVEEDAVEEPVKSVISQPFGQLH
jgi:hypothetical protein